MTLHLPWLEFAILAPLIGALAARGQASDKARRYAILASSLALASATAAWIDLTATRAFEAHDGFTLLGWLPGGDPFVIDELSAPLVPLAALQFLLTFLATLRSKSGRFSFALNQISEALVLATLASKSPCVIAVLMGFSIVPPLVEIIRRGESPRLFALHMGPFIGLLLLGVSATAAAAPGGAIASLGMLCILVAVLIRSGVAPFHLWLTDLYERASFGCAILYTTPMIGAYAALRLLLPAAPDWALRIVAAMSLAMAIYATGMALVQRDARRFFAFLMLSHASLVLVGLELMTLLGLTGALCVWLSIGLAMTGFGLTLRCVESRVGRLDLSRYRGLYDASPFLAGFFLLTGLASIGFPGTLGFIALEILIEGAIHSAPVVGVLILVTTALNGIAVTHAYFRIFTGAVHSSAIDLRARPAERVAVIVLSLLILGGGVAPQPGISSRRHAASVLLQRRQQPLEDVNPVAAAARPSHQQQTRP